ncbi:Conjugal transfer protein TraH [Escherichia coli]|uniref:Conjugal transfer protein TraH n=1 Tax=Escherichia coli TaxID=562 RepID=A0A377BCH1_ECOLX|nr:Conjugal transfer protein TraH [Escherichia coli]
MKKILLAGCIAATLPGVANALNVPQPTSYDARIQEATYNPDDAVLVRVKAGTSTLIKLQDGEFITDDQAGMGFGDPDAWMFLYEGIIFLSGQSLNNLIRMLP